MQMATPAATPLSAKIYRRLPNEIWTQIMRQFLESGPNPDERLHQTQRLSPHERLESLIPPSQVNKTFRDAYKQALRQCLWIVLTVRSCGHAHIQGESQNAFNIIHRKLLDCDRFREVSYTWLQNMTQQAYSKIQIGVECCVQSRAQPTSPDIVACFPSRDVIDRSLIEFLNSIVLRYTEVGIDGIGMIPGVRPRAILFMNTLCSFLRNVGAVQIGDEIQALTVPAEIPRMRSETTDPTNPQTLSTVQPILEAQMESAIALMRTGVMQYSFLPEFLDTANRHRRLYRAFTHHTGNNPNSLLHRQLLSSIASHTAFTCSGLAQYLLTRNNVPEVQGHYTMPNRLYHDQWLFHSREQFWTPFLEDLDDIILEGQHPITRRLDSINSNHDLWCTLLQAMGELSLAFARAALVVGDDIFLFSQTHADEIPDIRFNSLYSRDPHIRQHQIIETRIGACERHLERASRMISLIRSLYLTYSNHFVNANRRPRVRQWLIIYCEMYDQIERALKPMRFNRIEKDAREEEEQRQQDARDNPVYIIGRKSRRRKMRLPVSRRKRRMKSMRNVCFEPRLRPPYLLQQDPLIDYDIPPFIRPTPNARHQYMRYPDTGRPFHWYD